MKSKFTVLCLLVFTGLFLLTPSMTSANYLNLVGEEGSSQQKLSAFQSGDDWLVDLHDFFQALDFDVLWKNTIQRFEADKKGTTLRFRPETERVLVDGRTLSLIDSPTIHEGRLYLHARAVANLINRHTDKSVIWNPTRRQLQVASASAWAQESGEDPIGSFIDDMPDQDDDELLVIIDPGHGGRDPGAIGHNGIQEKSVVLDISSTIKQYLENNHPKIKPRLTRDNDQFIPLSRRTQIANDMEGNVFLSIHANANRSSQAKGFEVYTLSGEATNPSGQELAKIENSALRYEGYEEKELDDISWILYQLGNSVHVRESQHISRMIMDRADKDLPIPTRRSRQAPFWVLKDARMPAILVETGFLSNPDEEEVLQSRAYQESVAKVLAEALDEYREKRFQ